MLGRILREISFGDSEQENMFLMCTEWINMQMIQTERVDHMIQNLPLIG